MRVALYHPWIYLKSGLERTLLEIHCRSRHEWTFYTGHYDAEGTYPGLREAKIVQLGQLSVRRAYAPVLQAAWRIGMSRIDPAKHDALVVSCDGLGDLITLRNRQLPLLCLAFTPLRAVYDAEYRTRHLARLGWKRPAALAFEQGFRLLDRFCWSRYDGVVAISGTVRQRIVEGGLAVAGPIEVLHPGIDAGQIRPSSGSEPFFLVTGRIMWTKNIELAIEAFALARPRLEASWRLVVAGMVDEKSRPYFERLGTMAERVGGVEFQLSPSDADMRSLYERCTALLFTAFNEDWGITPIEAMAVAKPVIAVDRGGPREVVVDGETGFLEADRPDAFAARMIQLAADPTLAASLGAAGSVRAARFTWDRFVSGLDESVQAIARRVAQPGVQDVKPSPVLIEVGGRPRIR